MNTDKDKQTISFDITLRLLTDDEIKQFKENNEEIPKCVIEIGDGVNNEKIKKVYSYIYDIETLADVLEIKVADIGGLKCRNRKNLLETVIISSMLIEM